MALTRTLGVQLAIAAVVCGGVLTRSEPAGASTGTTVVTVAEMGCLTFQGVGPSPVTSIVPRRTRLRVPVGARDAFSHLSLYVGAAIGPNDTVVPGHEMLAPTGWYCSGGVGADGNATLTITPRSQVKCLRANDCGAPDAPNPSIRPTSVVLSELVNGNMYATLCAYKQFARSFARWTHFR